jgi:hypothetical protein
MYDQKKFLKKFGVYIRPYGEGEYLVFPEGYKNGGKGYIFSEQQISKVQKKYQQIKTFLLLCILMVRHQAEQFFA